MPTCSTVSGGANLTSEDDFDNYKKTGAYLNNHCKTNLPGGAYDFGMLLVFRVAVNVFQIYIPLGHLTQDTNHRICVRSFWGYNSTWHPWDTYLPTK